VEADAAEGKEAEGAMQMSTSPYNQYTGSKPLPKWLEYVLLWVVLVPIMLGYVAWGCIKMAVSRPHREAP
jgi:hypothetical protein